MSGTGAQTNGPSGSSGKYIDGINPDDPEYIKNLQRPAEVKEDLQQMENRSRVKMVLSSEAFRDELEEIVTEHLQCGPYPETLIALKQITDLLMPQARGSSIGNLGRGSTVIPINDLRGVESAGFVKGEKLLRCKLAALYRLIDLCGWSHGIYNHISARVNADDEHFLLNPFGLMYSEVTASSLVKVDVNGSVIEQGSSQLGVNKAGFTLHSAIHQARPDIKCIVHLHTPAAVAVSAMKCGFLPMSQEALIIGNVSYHDYTGIIIDADEKEALARNLGVHNKVMFMRNHGVVACGETVEETFHKAFNLMAACEAQIRAIPAGIDNIILPSEEVRQQVFQVGNKGGGGVETTGKKWKVGELEFEALMRTLDNSGYRTGYLYRMPMVKQEKKDRSNSEVEIPPTSSSFSYMFDGDETSKYASPLKAAMERQKKAYKAGWLTTPNAYKKTELEEIGTTTPKKITKWVSEGESAPGSVKIESPNQFAPQGDNPKEYKEHQKRIKKDYYEEKINAGPQSKILDGMSWEEAQQAKDGQLSGAGDQVIVVGAASKGIIKRDHQHNAVVYRQYYAANPFENMSEADIENYQREVQRKEAGEPEVNDVLVEAAPQEPEPVEDSNRQPQPVPVQRESLVSEGHDAHAAGLARLAEEVVRTVIRDALAVARQGKGQQSLTGGTGFDDALDDLSNQRVMGGQTVGEEEEAWVNVNNSNSNRSDSDNRGRERIKARSVPPSTNHSDSYRPKRHSSQNKNPSLKSFEHDGDARRRLRGGKAAAASEKSGPSARLSDELKGQGSDEYVSVQMNPIHLYHGQTQGRMKIKFSIQSTVRRRISAEIERGSSIEEIYASVSEPVVHHFRAEDDNGSSVGVDNSAEDIGERVSSGIHRGSSYRMREPTVPHERQASSSSVNDQSREPVRAEASSSSVSEESRDPVTAKASYSSVSERSREPVMAEASHSKPLCGIEKVAAVNDDDDNNENLSPKSKAQTSCPETIFGSSKTNEATHTDKNPKASSERTKPKIPKKKAAKSKKKMKHKVKREPLTPVQEYFEGTVEEMEEFEAVLQNADDSFERLLITAEDSLLLCVQSEQEYMQSHVLNLNEFIGIAPIVADESEEIKPEPVSNRQQPLSEQEAEETVDRNKNVYGSPVMNSAQKKAAIVNPQEDRDISGHEPISNVEPERKDHKMGECHVYPNMYENTEEERTVESMFVPENTCLEDGTSPISPVEASCDHYSDSQRPTSADTSGDLSFMDALDDLSQEDPSEITFADAMEDEHCEWECGLASQGASSKDSQQTFPFADEDDAAKHKPDLVQKIEMPFDELTSVKKTETMIDEPMSVKKTETMIDEPMSVKKTETMIDEPMSVKKTETMINEPMSVKKTKTMIDEPMSVKETEPISVKKTETMIDEPMSVKKTETMIDEPMSVKKTETMIDEPMSVKKTETMIDEPMSVKKTKMMIDEPMSVKETEPISVKKTETMIDETMSVKKTETMIDEPMSVKKTKMMIDEPMSVKKTETMIDEPMSVKTMSVKKTETMIDEPMSVKKTKMMIDEPMSVKETEPISVKKTETMIDEPMSVKKTETMIDEPMSVKKTETMIDEPMSVKKTETMIDEPMSVKKTKTMIDEPMSVKKTKTMIDEPMSVKETEPMSVKKTETMIDEPMSVKKTETNIDDCSSIESYENGKMNFDESFGGSIHDVGIETNVDEATEILFQENEIVTGSLPSEKDCLTDNVTPVVEKEPAYYDTIVERRNRINQYSMPGQKLETVIDDFMPLDEKNDENEDNYLPIIHKMTNIDDFIKINETETIDRGILSKTTETFIEDFILPDKVETAFYDSVSTSNKETVIDGIGNDGDDVRSDEDDGIQMHSPKTGNDKMDESRSKSHSKSVQSLNDFDSSPALDRRSRDKDSIPSNLVRCSSLDPHHRKERESKVNVDENNVPEPFFHSSRSILDEFHLKKHNELMELSSAKSFFTPPVITVYPVTGCHSPSEALPPLPDTVDVPSVSDDEEACQRAEVSRKQKPRMHAVPPPQVPKETSKWKPKPRRQKAGHQSVERENVPSTDRSEAPSRIEKPQRDVLRSSRPTTDKSDRDYDDDNKRTPEGGKRDDRRRREHYDRYGDDGSRRHSRDDNERGRDHKEKRQREQDKRPGSERDGRRKKWIDSDDEERSRENNKPAKDKRGSSEYVDDRDRRDIRHSRRDKRERSPDDGYKKDYRKSSLKDKSKHGSDDDRYKGERKDRPRKALNNEDRNKDSDSRRSRRPIDGRFSEDEKRDERNRGGERKEPKGKDLSNAGTGDDYDKERYAEKFDDRGSERSRYSDSRKGDPIDTFLNSPRYEMDVENSSRLQRRRGGAIAKELKDKRSKSGKPASSRSKPASIDNTEHLLSPGAIPRRHRSTTSLVSTGSHRSRSGSPRTFLSPDNVPGNHQFNHVTGKPYNFTHPLMLSMESLVSGSNVSFRMLKAKSELSLHRHAASLDRSRNVSEDEDGGDIKDGGVGKEDRDHHERSERTIPTSEFKEAGKSSNQMMGEKRPDSKKEDRPKVKRERERDDGRGTDEVKGRDGDSGDIDDEQEYQSQSRTEKRRKHREESDINPQTQTFDEERPERKREKERRSRRERDFDPEKDDRKYRKSRKGQNSESDDSRERNHTQDDTGRGMFSKPKEKIQRKIGVDETNMRIINQDDFFPDDEKKTKGDRFLDDSDKKKRNGKPMRDKASEEEKGLKEPENEPPLLFTVDPEMSRRSSEDDLLPPPKKGFLSKLSCMGGKGADATRKKQTATIKAPLEKTSSVEHKKKDLDYYEEGERRKTQKLSKHKQKEDKTGFYFQQEYTEDESESEVNKTKIPEESHKKMDTFQSPRSLSSFAPDSKDERDYTDYFNQHNSRRKSSPERDTSGPRRHNERKGDRREERRSSNSRNVSKEDEDKASARSDSRKKTSPERDTSARRHHERKDERRSSNGRSVPKEGEDKASARSDSRKKTSPERDTSAWRHHERKDERRSSNGRSVPKEDDDKASARCGDRRPSNSRNVREDSPRRKHSDNVADFEGKTWEPRARRDKQSNLRSRSSKSLERPKDDLASGLLGEEVITATESKSVTKEEPPAPSSSPGREEINSDLVMQGNNVVSGQIGETSFDLSEPSYLKRHERRFSHDITSAVPYSTDLPTPRSGDSSPVRRRMSQVSLATGSSMSRSRSASVSSSPLSYQPWRSKVRRRSRSMSISEMVYAAGAPKPRDRSNSVGEVSYLSAVAGNVARRRSRSSSVTEITSRMYQPRLHSRRGSLGEASLGSVAPLRQRKYSGSPSFPAEQRNVSAAPVKRSDSERQPSKNPQLIEELDRKSKERGQSERRPKASREELGENKPVSPSKSDTLKSTDSASGGETLEDRSSKEGSPTKEHPAAKDKKKKKKFRIPSFSKKKNKESKESAI